MSKRAIIVVDIQNEYFPDGKLLLEGIEEAASNAAKVIEHARSANELVVYVQHESADPEFPFFIAGTQEVAIHPVVAPVDQQSIEEVVLIGAMSYPAFSGGLPF